MAGPVEVAGQNHTQVSMVVGNPYRLSVDCWCECMKELVLACCHNSGFSMPELSVPRFDHHGKGNGNLVQKRVSKNEKSGISH